MNAAETLWKKACEFLAGVFRPDVYTRWIEIIRPVTLDGNTLHLSVDNDFTRDWLVNNHQQAILEALGAAGAPADISVVFEVEADDAVETDPIPRRSPGYTLCGDPTRRDPSWSGHRRRPTSNARG